MKTHRSVWSLAAVAWLGLSALASGSVAHARDLAWSVGIASPGVHVGVSSGPPFVYPQPVVVLPAPVHYGHPHPVYYGQPQVVYVPAPRYVQAGWARPGHKHGWGPHGRWHHGGRDRGDDRHGVHRGGAGNGRH
jgi:hypothetical protein